MSKEVHFSLFLPPIALAWTSSPYKKSQIMYNYDSLDDVKPTILIIITVVILGIAFNVSRFCKTSDQLPQDNVNNIGGAGMQVLSLLQTHIYDSSFTINAECLFFLDEYMNSEEIQVLPGAAMVSWPMHWHLVSFVLYISFVPTKPYRGVSYC